MVKTERNRTDFFFQNRTEPNLITLEPNETEPKFSAKDRNRTNVILGTETDNRNRKTEKNIYRISIKKT